MSDYLDHLVARSLNRAEVVQPRPASRFEPSPAAGVALSSAPGETAPDERFTGETPAEDPVGAERPRENPIDGRAPRLEAGRSGAQPLPAGGPEPVTPVLVAVTTGQQSVTPSSSLQAPERQLAAGPGNRLADSELAAVRDLLRGGRPEPASAPATEGSRPPPFTAGRATALSGSSAPVPSGRDAAEEDARSIKITIGRVDVRAVMPAAPPPRPTAARRGPSLSLDAYLKERRGGKQ